jgi:hypothetical protein
MFYNPGSRHIPGSKGIVQGRRVYVGDFEGMSPAARNYLSQSGGFKPPPFGRLVAFELNSPQNSNTSVITGVSETTSVNTSGTQSRPAGIYGLGYATPPSGINVGNIRGGDFDGIFNGAGSADSVVGTVHYAEIDQGTVTTLACLRTVGPFRVGGTVTNSYGVWVGQGLVAAATVQVGVQVEGIGAANGFAIRTSGTDPIQIPGISQLSQIAVSPSAAVGSFTNIDNTTSLIQIQGVAGTWGQSQVATGTGSANGLGIAFAKTRGANAATHAIVNNNDVLGFLWTYGDDGVNYQESSGIAFEVDGTPGVNNIPGRIRFQTVSTGQFLNEVGRWDSSGRLGIGVTPSHFLDLKAGTTSIASFRMASGSLLTTAAAGVKEFDGKAFYATSVASARQVLCAQQIQILSGTRTFTNNTSAQAIFNATANGAVTLAASTTYEFEMIVAASGFSSSAHTINLGFGGTATFTGIQYYYEAQTGSTLAGPTAVLSGWIAAATATAIIASTTTTGLLLRVRGTMRINAGGTVIPQLTQVTASAAAVVQAQSYFRCWPIGSDTVVSVGNWS